MYPSDDYQLITVGFKEQWSYQFVVQNGLAPAQIFDYLPKTVSYPFGDADLNMSDIFVRQLVPFTSTDVDYLITVAEIYFPKQHINDLQNAIRQSSSSFYANPDSTLSSVAQMVDSRIPLTGLLSESDSQTGTQSATGTATTGESGNGAESNGSGNSDNSNNNSGSMDAASNASSLTVKSRGKIAGITVGSVAGVALYLMGLALFYKSRKKKAMSAMGSPSIPHSYAGVPSAGGAIHLSSSESSLNLNNANHPAISQPVNQSNSLGWV